jgi:hypothetical protein
MDISEPLKKSELEVTNHGELFKQQALKIIHNLEATALQIRYSLY